LEAWDGIYLHYKNNLPIFYTVYEYLKMSQRTHFICYQPKTILNKGKRADHWFWTRYSAYPYLGCQHGCVFCYCRERKYIPHKPTNAEDIYDTEADEFSHLIKVKQNAPQLLRKTLANLPVDVIFTGDYQPAENKFKLSRQILEVCLELGFPVFVLTRSPLVLRDLDLFQAINQRAKAVVAFSIISTPESLNYQSVSMMEGLAPKADKRFHAMHEIAKAGILTGTMAMPLLPGLSDDDQNLRALVRRTAGNGGQFILGSGLTLADQQKEFFLQKLSQIRADLLPLYTRLYPPGSYAQAQPWRQVGLRIREYCQQEGISDRMPRPVITGEKRSRNKRIVELLADQCYSMDLENASASRIWAYRKAAWAVEDLEQDIGLVYKSLGLKGLECIPNINPTIARKIEASLGSV
jgi:DNA repair photolyase